jgi:CheY-like chemotaxis protein
MHTVLLVEDQDLLRKLLNLQLRGLGYSVVEAREGNEALSLLDHHPISVVLTDLVMPGMNGIQTIAELRRRQPGLKIIAMSGGWLGNGEDGLSIARGLGAQGTIEKPFGHKELVATLESVLAA